MARYPRKSIDEKIEAQKSKIVTAEEVLKHAKDELEGLMEQKKNEELGTLYQLMEEKNLKADDILRLIQNQPNEN